MSSEDAKKLKNPVANTKKSIGQGRNVFIRICAACHGNDGKAQIDVVADATDLTNPKVFKSGTSEGEIFRSIRDGAGETMPPFKTQISKEEDFWHLVNFIRNLWPDGVRPAVEPEK
jgi:mono/diheme cytochrome c family protein